MVEIIRPVKDIISLDIKFGEKYTILKAAASERKKEDLQLAAILSKHQPYEADVSPKIILERNSLPGISTEFRNQLRSKVSEISPQFIKDGYVYAFRGDYPNLAKKGLYSYRFQEINLNLDQMLSELRDEPLQVHWNFHPGNKLEEFMWIHSNGGCENFLSTTTDYRIAQRHPDYKENSGTVYVLRIPIQQAFNNYASVVSGNEQEILVADYVLPESIIGVINPHDHEQLDIRDFM